MIELVLFLLFFILIYLYIKISIRLDFFDIPNERSSHSLPVVRGAGLVLPISVLIAYFYSDYEYTVFISSLSLIALISFFDDIFSLSNILRFAIQFIVSVAMIFQLDIQVVWWIYPIILFILIGGINAFNFMDGVNGMTAIYSLVFFSTLYYINSNILFVNSIFIIFPFLAILAFAFFNFRNKALCFLGDVGSVSIAFISLFLLLKLILHTGNIFYLLLLLIYALDSGCTIIQRYFSGHTIFHAHRNHLYQKLVDSQLLSHLSVSLIYAFVQILINGLVIFFVNQYYILTIISFICCISYIFVLSKFKHV